MEEAQSPQPERAHEWKSNSRLAWQNTCTPEEFSKTARQTVPIGCLQRIADALERIADLLDPEQRRQLAARAKKARKREEDEKVRTAVRETVQALVKAALCPLVPDAAHRLSVERAGWPLANYCLAVGDPDPVAFARSLDLLALDWKLVNLHPKTRVRVEAVLALARAAKA